MTDSQLTDLLAESSHAFEDRTSGLLRHLQWHLELAEELQNVLLNNGYRIIGPADAVDPNEWPKR